jgi:hypothetical protein
MSRKYLPEYDEDEVDTPPSWRPWGDHPFIIFFSLLVSFITILGWFTGITNFSQVLNIFAATPTPSSVFVPWSAPAPVAQVPSIKSAEFNGITFTYPSTFADNASATIWDGCMGSSSKSMSITLTKNAKSGTPASRQDKEYVGNINITLVGGIDSGYTQHPLNEFRFLICSNAGFLPLAQESTLNFHDGYGKRQVGVFFQNYVPFSDNEFVYLYRGITNDEQYAVQVSFRVTAPDDFRIVPTPDFLQSTSQEDVAAYNADVGNRLDVFTPTAFHPDLEQVDAIIASLRIESPPLTK